LFDSKCSARANGDLAIFFCGSVDVLPQRERARIGLASPQGKVFDDAPPMKDKRYSLTAYPD